MHHSTHSTFNIHKGPVCCMQLGHSCIHKAFIWLHGEEAHVEGFTHSTRSAQKLPQIVGATSSLHVVHVLHAAAACKTHCVFKASPKQRIASLEWYHPRMMQLTNWTRILVEWENGWKLHLHIILIKDMNKKGGRSRFVEAMSVDITWCIIQIRHVWHDDCKMKRIPDSLTDATEQDPPPFFLPTWNSQSPSK